MTRQEIAAQAMCALIATRRKYNTKKQLCDNAIAYADMLMRRLGEIPTDAQQRSEAGQTHAELGQSEVTKTSDQELEPKKLDADEVIAWIEKHASLFAANWAIMEDVIEQFKKDFGL